MKESLKSLFIILYLLVTADGKPIVIDFANVCKASKEYDIARTCFLMEEASAWKLAEAYLEQMNVSFEEIKTFYEVMVQFRNFELE